MATRSRSGARALAVRAGTFAAGVAVGVAPLIAYNLWAFGSVTHFSYADAVDQQGRTGHATLGLNDGGFFGIDVPSLRAALELLLAPRGLLVITPVVADGASSGTVLLHRRGRRAEALVDRRGRGHVPASTTPATGCRSAAARPARAS